MANHKKRKPANARGHCKMCKYWKINGMCRDNPNFERHSDHKRRMWAKIEAKETTPDKVEEDKI